MSEKVTIQPIIDSLAEKHGIPKKEAEAVVRKMFEVIEEALTTEKYIKVKGLGTFKLTEVDRRESVNIKTGERIEIQEHTKISFTPDNQMKDLINKPFAHFDTVILNKGTQLEDTATEVEGAEEDTLLSEEPLSVPEADTSIAEEEVLQPTATMEEASDMHLLPVSSEETVCSTEVTPIAEEVPTMEILPVNEELTEPMVSEVPDTTEVTQATEEAPAVPESLPSMQPDDLPETAIPSEETGEVEEAVVPSEEEGTETSITEPETSSEATTPEEENSTEELLVEPEVPIESTAPEEKTAVEEATAEPEVTARSANRWGIIVALLLLLGIGGGIYWWMMYRTDKETVTTQPATSLPVQPEESPLSQPKDSAVQQTDSLRQQPVTTAADTLRTVAPQLPAEKPQPPVLASQTPKPEEMAKVDLSDTIEYDITGTKTTYTLREGETLIKVASKFYGSKKFWPYIVKHNKNVIKNADVVPVGTTLRIPELSPHKQ